MAKLNEVQTQPVDSLEALKRRYQRQNRDLARANANQSVTIQALQLDIMNINAENLRLNGELIRLQSELERNSSRRVMENVNVSKQKLELRLAELAEMVRELGTPKERLSLSVPKRSPKAKRDDSQRPRREGYLPDIRERRSSSNFDDLRTSPRQSLSNTQVEDFRMSHTSPLRSNIVLESPMFDTRPRRRRDSTTPAEYGQKRVALTEIESQIIPDSNDEVNEIITESYLELPQNIEAPVKSPELHESITTAKISKDEARDMEVTSENETKLVQNVYRKSISPVKTDIDKLTDFLTKKVDELRPITLDIPEPPVRRALGPKSVNTDPTNSLVKVASSEKKGMSDEKALGDPTKPLALASALKHQKSLSASSKENRMVRSTTPTEEAKAASSGTERARRTRGVSVNYAQPSLNKKLRRETETLVDAVIVPGSVKKKSSKDAESIAEVRVEPKQENLGDWKHINEAGETFQPPEVVEVKLEEQQPISQTAEGATNQDVFANIMSHRKRRTSTLFTTIPELAAASAFSAQNEEAANERNRREKLQMDEARKDIFDFTLSSSPEPVLLNKQALATRSQDVLPSISSNFGQSTNQRQLATDLRSSEDRLKLSQSALLDERRRRRATLAGVTSSSEKLSDNVAQASYKLRESGNANMLRRTKSRNDGDPLSHNLSVPKGQSTTTTQEGKAERVERRRSMML